MEEDIEKIDRLITIMKSDFRTGLNYKYELEALENLIKAYKELEEENKELKKDNKRYEKELHDVIEFSIPVSLVEEKIEEIDKIYKCIPEDEGNFAKAILIKEKQVLQELLEKRK